MNRKNAKLRAVDFFCGGGGMSLGMGGAGIEIVAGIDNDPGCRETYKANHPDSRFIQADITELPIEELGEQTGISKDDDNLIFIGCSPCQHWSIITGHGDSERKKASRNSRNLLRDFHRFVDHYRPGFVVIENVRGIERNSADSGLAELRSFFDDNGYRHQSGALSVNDFGVPQTRRRFILVASRVLGSSISLPQKTGDDRPTVANAIGGKNSRRPIKAGECDPNDDLHKSPALSDTNIERLKLTKEGCDRASWHHRDDLQINAYRDRSIDFFRENYGRMAWDKPAPTITTRFTSISCGRFAHPKEHRAISLREGALLQTFPETYRFMTSSFVKTARIIGNAVPPKFAQAIGASILQQWRTYSTKRRARA